MIFKNIIYLLFGISLWTGCKSKKLVDFNSAWKISILPSTIRINPVTNEIIDFKPSVYTSQKGVNPGSLLSENWIYDGKQVNLKGARGEYISFQLVISKETDSVLKNIRIELPPFKSEERTFASDPELFLEWAVKVETESSGYPQASLGTGWYPDALIPFKYIQQDSSLVKGRWIYPLWLPDFNNRISGQKSMVVWVDQYIPFEADAAPPGDYQSSISVTINNVRKEIPVNIHVWDFAVPNENKFEASLQHEGFLSQMNEKDELEVYQLFKRNRIGLMDPTYKPELKTLPGKRVSFDWINFDNRLNKYFTGAAFTKEMGYEFGPGYGEPIETFILPFDVYGKHGTKGWPDIGTPAEERKPENRAAYIKAIEDVRDHLAHEIDIEKTDIIAYLNGLDESYFPEAWDRMVYYGELFHKYYPGVKYRIDGAYDEEAMKVVGRSIDYWSAHTLNYNIDSIRAYRELGVKDWVYGPLIYETKVNSWVGSSTFIDLPLINDRAISWACWKYGTYSWISWGVAAGGKRGWYDPESWKDQYKYGAEYDSSTTFKKLNGNALLMYEPGIVPNVQGFSPSIRLKMMRDGVQDYEYMKLLANSEEGRTQVDSIVNQIIFKPFGDKSIGNINVWEFDPAKWDAARVLMGDLIEKNNTSPSR